MAPAEAWTDGQAVGLMWHLMIELANRYSITYVIILN